MCLHERGHDVQIQRVSGRAWLLGAIEHGNRGHRGRQRPHEQIGGKGPIQPHLQDTDLVSASRQCVNGLVRGLRSRSHEHDHALGLGVADVVEQTIVAAGHRAQLRHHPRDVLRARGVEAVARFARLEEGVGILCRASNHRVVGRQRARPVLGDSLRGQQREQIRVRQRLDPRDFMGRAKPVEEVQERHACVKRGRMRHGGEIVRLLDRRGAEQREPRLPAGHDVGVIAEDGQRMRGDRPRRDVHRERRQLAGDLVHVGEHQQKAL